MKVVSVEAIPLSLDLRDRAVTLGVGTAIKKDTVIVRVLTEDGIVGYGEAHHALAPTVVAELVNTSLVPLVVGYESCQACKSGVALVVVGPVSMCGNAQ